MTPAPTDVQVAITLSSIAYEPGDTDAEIMQNMANALKQKDLPTAGQWGIVWGPVTHESDLMYIVRKTGSTSPPTYAVVIRGTVMSFESILQDLEVLRLVPLPWKDPKAPAGTTIASGIATAFGRLQAMQRPGDKKTALQFLQSINAGSKVIVTGHSLGGCLASVVPLWLLTEIPTLKVKPITFAGQSAGNATFASHFTAVFGDSARYFNTLDLIPRIWQTANVQSITELFPSPGPTCDIECEAVVDAIVVAVKKKDYTQLTSTSALPGTAYSGDSFVDEAEQQHSHLYYMYLTGISLKVIQGTLVFP